MIYAKEHQSHIGLKKPWPTEKGDPEPVCQDSKTISLSASGTTWTFSKFESGYLRVYVRVFLVCTRVAYVAFACVYLCFAFACIHVCTHMYVQGRRNHANDGVYIIKGHPDK